MKRIKKNDQVVVITGKDKGRTGQVLRIYDDQKVLVEGINQVKKHQKPNPQKNEEGGIITKEMPIQISNVMLFNPQTQKGDRISYKTLDDGRKVRVFKSNGEVVDI